VLINETVYIGRDNTIELALTIDGNVINHTLITRVQLIMGGTVLDSDVSPAFFNFANPDRLIMRLGGAGFAAGRHSATLIIYDAGSPNGIVWGNLALNFKA
jgi:hypothetical protein